MAGRNALFHGTISDIGVGNNVLPSSQTGNSVWGKGVYGSGGTRGSKVPLGQDARESAHATEDEGVAWRFAKQARGFREDEHRVGYADKPPGRARVYSVAPNPAMKPGVFHGSRIRTADRENLKEWIAPRFRTTEEINIQPGRQGTFPELNWNQFLHKDAERYFDANHPKWDEIEEGHPPALSTPSGKKALDRTWRSDPPPQGEMPGQRHLF